MTISYNWLKTYIDADLSIEELSQTLTDIGLEVESIESQSSIKGGLQGVLIGQVSHCEQHPDADKLRVTKVDIGAEEHLQIVCGAPNVALGQKVAVATIGTHLYFSNGEEIKIKKSKLRGVESQGMLCAEDELGLGSSHEGIMVLAPEAKVGQPLSELLNIENDYILEIGLTPNRIDAASHFGVARDLAAYLKTHAAEKLKRFSPIKEEAFAIDSKESPLKIKIENPEACPRYSGITISGLKIEASPAWLQTRLNAIGVRPINNVVDITNFVLHELGQPLHAFDADKIDGKEIIIKTCAEGTPFTTLDGVERKLSAQDLMICSASKPLCIAGVFGGEESGVSENTKNIFLESAYFNPVWVRKTAKRHALSTDASFRFERGADPNITPLALSRAASLIKEIAGGKISSEIIDNYPQKIEAKRIHISHKRICASIGKEIEEKTILQILTSLDFVILEKNEDTITIEIPTYRVDVSRECDVVEEILRIYGYNNIEIPQHIQASLNYSQKPDNEEVMNAAANLLSGRGFSEIMCLSLTNAKWYDTLSTYPQEQLVMLQNPNSQDLNAMRQCLLFGNLEVANYNINRRQSDLKLYEFGNVYKKGAPQGAVEERFHEEMHLSLLVTGDEHKKNWNVRNAPTNFFSLKQQVETLLTRFGIDLNTLQSDQLQTDLFSDGAAYKLQGKSFLQMGIIKPSISKIFDLKQAVFCAELRWKLLIEFIAKQKTIYQELPKYPEVTRDLALLIDQKTSFAELRNAAMKCEKKILRKLSLFDVYEGDKLPEGKKSYALSFVLQDNERTLTDKDIEQTMTQLMKMFEDSFGAQIR
ncbi:MAG: phenylalanine--tRNA ligase subunit beta [Bacteroidales bacterium]